MLRLKDAAATILIGMAGFSSALAQRDRSVALREIRETAIEICYTVQQRGKKTDSQLNGEVHAKVTGVFGKLVDIGAATSGQTGTAEYEGVTQEALGAALTASLSCRERVASKLIDALLPPQQLGSPSNVSPNRQSGPTPAVANTNPGQGSPPSGGTSAPSTVTAQPMLPQQGPCTPTPRGSVSGSGRREQTIVPPLRQPSLVQVAIDAEEWLNRWPGFGIVARRIEGLDEQLQVSVMTDSGVRFLGVCAVGQEFDVPISPTRTIVGQIISIGPRRVAVAFRDE